MGDIYELYLNGKAFLKSDSDNLDKDAEDAKKENPQTIVEIYQNGVKIREF